MAVAVHPGLVDTELARGWLTGADVMGATAQRFVAPIAKLLAPWLLIQPERAVESILYAATAPADQVGILPSEDFHYVMVYHPLYATPARRRISCNFFLVTF